MANAYTRLEQSLKDMIEAYTEIEQELEDKHGEDEDAFSHAIIEALETAIEGALEEQDTTTGSLAAILSNLTESLEQLDPAAFDEDAGEEKEEYEDDAEDIDDDGEDYDLDEEDMEEEYEDDYEEDEEE